MFHNKREQTVSQVPSGGLGFGASMLEITSCILDGCRQRKRCLLAAEEGRAAARQKKGRPTKYLKEG